MKGKNNKLIFILPGRALLRDGKSFSSRHRHEVNGKFVIKAEITTQLGEGCKNAFREEIISKACVHFEGEKVR